MLDDWPQLEEAWTHPGAQGSNLRFKNFPAFILMALSSLAKTSLSRACLDPAGLSVAEWRVLSTVQGTEGMSFAQLVAATGMDKGQLSRTLRTAQGKKLVVTDVMPLDHKAPETTVTSIGRVMVHITPIGQRLYEQVLPGAQISQLQLLELMSPAERRALFDLSLRLQRRLATDLQSLA